MPDEFDNLRKLSEAISKVLKKHGLQGDKIAFLPGRDGEPNVVEMLGFFGSDIFRTQYEREQLEIDKSFEEIISFDIAGGEDPEMQSLLEKAEKLLEEMNDDDTDED